MKSHGSVLLVSPAEAFGGAEVYLEALSTYLEASGEKVILLAGDVVSNRLKLLLRGSQFMVDQRVVWDWKESEERNIRQQVDLIVETMAAIQGYVSVFINMNWLNVGTGLLVGLTQMNVKATVHFHLCPFNQRLSSYHVQLLSSVIHSHRLSCVSKDNALFIRRSLRLPFLPLRVIYNGPINQIDHTQMSASEVRAGLADFYGISKTTKWILTVGRHDAQKGFPDAIETFETLRQMRTDITYIWIGGGSSFQLHSSIIAKKDWSDCFKMIEQSGDVAKWMLSSDVFFAPSKYEGFSLSAVEAATIGLPVVAGNYSSFPELYDVETQRWLAEGGNMWSYVWNIFDLFSLNETDISRVKLAFRQTALRFTRANMLQSIADCIRVGE